MIDYLNRITPENITELGANEILVVPTNEAGRHGAGMALFAAQNFGLKYGHAWHLCGRCFALPTKDKNIRTLPISTITDYVGRFLVWSQNPMCKELGYVFLLPEIGCGLAGYTPEQIAPLFKGAIDLQNIHLPKRFWEVLTKKEQ